MKELGFTIYPPAPGGGVHARVRMRARLRAMERAVDRRLGNPRVLDVRVGGRIPALAPRNGRELSNAAR